MAHIQARNVFRINADKIRVEGRHAKDGEIDFETESGQKIRFNQVLDIDGSRGSFIQGKKGQQLIKDETGNAIMEVKSDGNLKLLTSVDFNNQAPVNFSGGGGGGATTTSGIDSENLPGQTLEDELDGLTTQQTTNTGAIATNATNIANNTANITTNTTNIATNTTAVSNLLLQQQTNTNDIATNTAGIGGLQTQQTTNTNNITTLQTTQGTQATSITNLQNQQTTNTNNITSLTTTQGTQGTDITALQTQQNLNTAAIASNTARTSNLTADRILISSATGTINTAGIGVSDVATKNSNNDFSAPLGNPATLNAFNTISVSSIVNTGTTQSNSYQQGGVPLNFSHLAGSASTAQLPTQAVRTDLPDQTIQGNPASSSLTKITLDNTHATGTSNLVLQKRTTAGVLEGGLTIQQTQTGTNITGQAPAGQTPDISITPANGSLAMTIGGLESRFHNNLKIIGSMSGAARSDNKDYIFKTIGSTGTGDVLLLEDVIQRPKAGNPALGFNPASDAVIQISSSGVPSYKLLNTFFPLPAGLPTNPSAVLIDSAGSTSYLDSGVVLTKPAGNNPSVRSFVAVETGGTFSYVPSTFLPLPGGLLPTSGENIIFVNPGGPSAYVDRANIIERPGGSNPTSGTKLITINNVGTRAYKDLGQFLTTPGGANPSSDSFIKISSTGVQSYVAESSLGGGGIQKPGGSNPGQQSLISIDTAGVETYLAESNLIKSTTASQTISSSTSAVSLNVSCTSTTLADEVSLKIERGGGVGDNFIEFLPKRGTFAEWRTKNDLRVVVNGQTKMGVGNHTVDMFKPLVMQNGNDIRLQQTFTAPANSSSTGSFGTIGFDSTHLYIAVGTNSWKRVALSTF